ncbi:MAG: Eco57I restriction-modification methylase domain-containing protein [Spirosomataceae bacterium]
MIQPNYNPDVLSCLANLSNDEVFTPPSLVNDILDLLPAELWSNPNAKFLDPVSKSGVFLREMAKRLMLGLETQIPDKQERINHIFSQQLYGIAITDLTALLSRRSVYCSKTANGKYSICDTFDDEQGNIRYQRMKHTWSNGKCTYCGASQEVYDREDALETYAYNFIHTDNPYNIFNMKFDVIVGNPPYQISTAGDENGAQAKPLYHLFVEQAKKLNSKYLVMIMPSRWFAGGWGLDEFRNSMLNDKSISELHDFPISSDCFPGVEIKGGVCYFLRDKDYVGKCKFVTHMGGEIKSEAKRFLKVPESDVLIRHNQAISILDRIRSLKEQSFESIVSTKKPFGFTTNYRGHKVPFPNAVELYGNKRIEYVEKSSVQRRVDVVDMYKVFISKAYGAGETFPHQIINTPIVVGPNTCCTETYLLVGPFKTKIESENVARYMSTKFFRFLVMLIKNTQDSMKKVYSFVPMQDFSKPWTDEKLYKKYGLTDNEIAFIESMIRPMDLTQIDDTDG